MTTLLDENGPQIEAIRKLFTVAEAWGLPLWLENGWAIDAWLGRITRPHEEIDIAFPEDRKGEYRNLMRFRTGGQFI